MKKLTIREIAEREIMKGKNFQETLKAVKKAYPQTGFSKKCYYWYRYHLKEDKGKTPPSLWHKHEGRRK